MEAMAKQMKTREKIATPAGSGCLLRRQRIIYPLGFNAFSHQGRLFDRVDCPYASAFSEGVTRRVAPENSSSAYTTMASRG
jgi:hypothetical protein